MRFRTALVFSSLIHSMAFGVLWHWPGLGDSFDAAYVVSAGQPITITFKMPTAPAEPEPFDVSREVLTQPAPADDLAPQPTDIARATDAPDPIAAATEPRELREPLPPSTAEPRPRSRDELPAEERPPAATRRTRQATPDVSVQAVVPRQSATEAGARVDQMPRKLPINPPPPYPLDALNAGIEGRVLILVSIRSDGRVADARISDSSGSPSLDQAALATVRSWRFEPARRDGRPVAYDVVVPVRFTINRG